MKIIIRTLAVTMMLLLFPVISWALGSVAVQAIGDTERTALYPTREMIEFGRIVAEANCVSCHGADGISKTAGEPHLAGQRTVYLYRVLKAFQSGERSDKPNNHNNFLNEKALISTSIYYSNLTPVHIDEHVDSAGTGEISEVPEAAEESAQTEEAGCVCACYAIRGTSSIGLE